MQMLQVEIGVRKQMGQTGGGGTAAAREGEEEEGKGKKQGVENGEESFGWLRARERW